MSICDNTTINQETPLKLQSIRKAKKTFSDPRIGYNGIIVFEAAAMVHDTDAEFAIIDFALKAEKSASTAVPVMVLKKYRGTLVYDTAHHC